MSIKLLRNTRKAYIVLLRQNEWSCLCTGSLFTWPLHRFGLVILFSMSISIFTQHILIDFEISSGDLAPALSLAAASSESIAVWRCVEYEFRTLHLE